MIKYYAVTNKENKVVMAEGMPLMLPYTEENHKLLENFMKANQVANELLECKIVIFGILDDDLEKSMLDGASEEPGNS